jgi:dephospho-CoA kinase
MLVIVVTGMPGAGKEGVVSRAIQHDFSVYRMGDVVRDYAVMDGISPERVGLYASSEREANGRDIWAVRVLGQINRDASKKIVIDGCRSDFEILAFRKHFGDSMILLAVHSSPKTRYERLVSRERADAPKGREEFSERDRRELDWGLGRVIALADYMIVNEGTMEEFRRNTDRILEKLSSAGSGNL